jgi:hypothetical protein
MFAACGWYFSAAINAKLPVHIELPDDLFTRWQGA